MQVLLGDETCIGGGLFLKIWLWVNLTMQLGLYMMYDQSIKIACDFKNANSPHTLTSVTTASMIYLPCLFKTILALYLNKLGLVNSHTLINVLLGVVFVYRWIKFGNCILLVT